MKKEAIVLALSLNSFGAAFGAELSDDMFKVDNSGAPVAFEVSNEVNTSDIIALNIGCGGACVNGFLDEIISETGLDVFG
jgi:hypothetical protein